MAKDREQRYQRGAEFAEDVRQLQELIKPGLDHNFAAAGAGDGTLATRDQNNQHTRTSRGRCRQCIRADGMAQTAKFDARRDSEGPASGSDSGCE